MSTAPTRSAAFILIDGFKLLTHPQVRLYAILPVIIGVILFSSLFYWLGNQIPAQAEFELWLNQHLWAWLANVASYMLWIIWPLFFISAYFIVAYTAVSIINLISAPFNGLLSEQVEKIWGYPSAASETGVTAVLKTLPRTFARELRKLVFSLKWLALLLILMFFPVLNLLSVLIGAWLMAIQFLDIPADNQQLSFKVFLQQLKQARVSALLFGLSVFIVSLIPLLNFILVPAAICAATALWHRNYHP